MNEREQIEAFVAALLAILDKGDVSALSANATTSVSGDGPERKIHQSYSLNCEVSVKRVK